MLFDRFRRSMKRGDDIKFTSEMENYFAFHGRAKIESFGSRPLGRWLAKARVNAP
jgi:hypothetical protein